MTDSTSDLGRVQRQQRFLAAVMNELGATRNPFTLIGAMKAVGDHVAVDDWTERFPLLHGVAALVEHLHLLEDGRLARLAGAKQQQLEKEAATAAASSSQSSNNPFRSLGRSKV